MNALKTGTVTKQLPIKGLCSAYKVISSKFSYQAKEKNSDEAFGALDTAHTACFGTACDHSMMLELRCISCSRYLCLRSNSASLAANACKCLNDPLEALETTFSSVESRLGNSHCRCIQQVP